MGRPELAAKGLWVVGLAGAIGVAWLSARPSRPTPAPTPAPAPPAIVAPTTPGPSRVWKDPSIDPALLERAYAPPSRPLPPAARPKTPRIRPSDTKLRKLQRQIDRGEVIVY